MRKLIIILFITAVVIAFMTPFQFLLNCAHDDSFYYIKTASNFSKGLGSTFDGINPTNGYHPLYFIFLVILLFIPNILFNASPEVLYRLIVLCHLFMIIGIQFFVVKAFKNIFKKDFKKTSVLLLFTLFSIFIFKRDFGLESHLACLIISIFLYIKSKELITGDENILLKSFLFAGLFLTRTDYIVSFIPIILLVDLYLSSRRKHYILKSSIILIATVFSYYYLNYIFFGSPYTISGKLLSNFPAVNIENNLIKTVNDHIKWYSLIVRIIVIFVVFVFFCVLNIKSKTKDDISSKFKLIILGLSAGSVIFILVHLTYNNYSIREWYITLPVFVTILIISILIYDKKIVLNISFVLSIMLLIYVLYDSRIKDSKHYSAYEYAKILNTIVNDKDGIYQVDYCGVVGFFSEKKVINGDGLINSFEYLDYLKNRKLDDYILKYNIKFYSTYSFKDLLQDSIYVDDYYYDVINGMIFRFPESSLIIERSFKRIRFAHDPDRKWYLFKFY